MKKRIKLTESTLRKIVKESVKKALNELGRGDRWYTAYSPRIEEWEETYTNNSYAININNGEIVKKDDAPEEPGLGSNWAYLNFILKYTACKGGYEDEPSWVSHDLEDWDAEVDSGDEKINSLVVKKFEKNIEAFFDNNSDEIKDGAEYVETPIDDVDDPYDHRY